MSHFLDLVRKRRSVRKYTREPVTGEQVARMLEAARLAPSGNNAQPWRFIVVRNQAMKERLYEVSGRQRFILEAPVVVAAVADPRAKMENSAVDPEDSLALQIPNEVVIKAVRDTAIAAEHMVMEACDMKLGTCWVAMFEQDDIKPVLDVPGHCFVVSLITIGYAAITPRESKRYALHEITFDEKYGRRVELGEYEVK